MKAGAEFPVSDRDLKFPHAFLLDASAGSGKTYNLSNRYIQFLLSDKVSRNKLSNILAITFTENATKEMKTRIISFLKEIYNDKAKRAEMAGLLELSDEELKKKADLKLNLIFDNYTDFNVGTIDSFILKILAVSVDELNVNPDYEIVFDNRKLINPALEKFFSSLEVGDKREIIDRFLLALNNSGGDSYLFNPAEEIREKFGKFMEKENKYLLNIIVPEADAQKKKKLAGEILEGIKALAKRYERLAPELYKGVDEALKAGDFSVLLNKFNSESGIFQKSRKIFKEQVANDAWFAEAMGSLNDKAGEYYELESAIFYRAFGELYLEFKEVFARVRRKTNILSLSQITSEISEYIKAENVPEIYLKLSARLNHFLIDEFQDTSLSQWNILRPLIEDSLAKNGSLFLIGDVKQAIYMFRNADYRIMNEFKKGGAGNKYLSLESLAKGAEKFSLAANFRSDERILEYVNRFFSSEAFKGYLEEKTCGDITGLLDSAQLVEEKKAGRGYVKTMVLAKGEKACPPGERQLSAREGVEAELKEKFLAAVKDMSGRFELEEMAVLVKKNDEVEKIVGWLNEAGIPVASFSSLDIRKRKLIREITALLAFLETPSDNLAFCAFLLGDLFAKSFADTEELRDFVFKNNAPRGETVLYAEFKKKYPGLWESFFAELFNKSGYLTVYELINLIYGNFSVYKFFREETAFLVKFADIAYNLNAGESSGGISGFLAHLEEPSRNEETFSVRLPEFIPAVRVMTFHKAKGLGFGAVINIFEDSRRPGGERIFYSAEHDGLVLRKINKKGFCEFSAALDKIYREEETDEAVQELNTLYVAMTRAGHELVNIVRTKGTGKLLSLFADYEAGKKENHISGGKKTPPYLEIEAGSGRNLYDFIRNNEKDSFETLRGNIYHLALSRIDWAVGIASLAAPSGQAGTCAPQGGVVPAGGISPDKIRGYVDRAADFYGSFPEKERKEAAEKIEKALARLGEYFKPAKGRSAKNEAEFISEKGAVCRVDRLVEDPDSVTVIDYKTGAEADYSGQMKFYLKTVSAALGKKVKALVYYIDTGEIKEVISN